MRLATLLRRARSIAPATALLALSCAATASAQTPARHPAPAPRVAYTTYTRTVYVAPAVRPLVHVRPIVVARPMRATVIVPRRIVVVRRPIIAAPAAYVRVYRR